MQEPPLVKFTRAGSRPEIPPNPESVPYRTGIYEMRYTGWFGRFYCWEGRPVFSV